MEKYTLLNEINVICVPAKSFPDGVMEAHQKLHSLFPQSEGRRYFGISRPNENGDIEYKAAAEEIEPGEASKYDCENFVIKSGEYVGLTITDYMQNVPKIGAAFQTIISRSDIDPNGCCVEWYLNENDLRCMVRLDQ